MTNPQIDVLQHVELTFRAGKKAQLAVETCARFLLEKKVTRFQFWPEDFKAICTELKNSGYRHDGFKVGSIKAVSYNKGR